MIYVCCSAYNEALDLPQMLVTFSTFAAASPVPVHMLVYDDGSSDGTAGLLEEAAARLPIIVLSSSDNRGLGYGIARLIEYVSGHAQADDVAVFMDADNSHDFVYIAPLFKKIKSGADVVIASRFQTGAHMEGFPVYRQLLSRLASCYFGLILALPGVRDYTSGFRAYRVGALQTLDSQALLQGKNALPRGFECQVALLYKLARFSKVVEVPFNYRYGAKKGASKMRLGRTIRRNIMMGLTIAMDRTIRP